MESKSPGCLASGRRLYRWGSYQRIFGESFQLLGLEKQFVKFSVVESYHLLYDKKNVIKTSEKASLSFP